MVVLLIKLMISLQLTNSNIGGNILSHEIVLLVEAIPINLINLINEITV